MQARKHAAELTAAGIGKRYGDFQALGDISLTIRRGEFLTLLGPSGSGKTTFLMILAGFVDATSGTLAMDGRDITRLPAEKRGFGMVFQGYALFPHMSVAKNIAFPLLVKGLDRAAIRTRVDEMIDRVGLRGHEKKRPAELSGGQQQRVALARALAFEPAVLLLDEPFSALDKNLRGSMQEEVRRLHQETGTTFVFVTHDQSEALALSTRVAIFNHGTMQQFEDPRTVYERPANRFVAEFLGDINILPVRGASFNGSHVTGRIGDVQIVQDALCGMPSGELAVRPEYMGLSVARPETGNAAPVTIETITYLGASMRFMARLKDGTPVVSELATYLVPSSFAAGTEAWIGWPQDRGYFL